MPNAHPKGPRSCGARSHPAEYGASTWLVLANDTCPLIIGYVAQITIYVPDDVARRIKREAKLRKKSVSAFIAELAAGSGASPGWPRDFFRIQGSCKGSLAVPEDPPPDELSL